MTEEPPNDLSRRIRQEIAAAWVAEPASMPYLTGGQARAGFDFTRATVDGLLGLLDELETEAALPEVARAAWHLWIGDAPALSDGNDLTRLVVWAALLAGYLDRIGTDRWPPGVDIWLSDTVREFRRWFGEDLWADVEARTASLDRPPGGIGSPTLTPPARPARTPIGEVPDGAFAALIHRRRFRSDGDREAMTGEESGADGPSDDGPRRYDLWYATNRMMGDSSDPSRIYGNDRDPDGVVHHGTCTVEVPRTHRFGSVGTAWWRRWARFEFRDDHLRLVEVLPFDSADSFFGELHAQLDQLDSSEREVLVYLHGFNVTFEQAAIRAAQIGFDLKIAGATAFFSWPSAGNTSAYFADQDRIEASEQDIADFLIQLSQRTGAEAIHILAHSMGNRGLARAIQRITSEAARTADVRFGQIILAAPDISVELFHDLAAVYPTLSRRTTMYASARDRALEMSGFLQDGSRAGFTPPVTIVPGIDTVEVTDIDLTMLGHGYFAEAEAVLYDISQLIQSDTDPSERPRLAAVRADGGGYWRIGA